MNDTDLGVYKAWDSLLIGVHEFTDLLQGAWNMFDSTSTAAQPIGGAVIPDVCYTELFQRRYLFYGKAPPERPLSLLSCTISIRVVVTIIFFSSGQCLLTFIVKIYGYVFIASMILGKL